MSIPVSQKTQYTLIAKKIIVLILFASFTFFSCLKKEKAKDGYTDPVKEGFLNSNKFIHQQSFRIAKSLENKLADPLTSARAEIWQPKATMISYLSSGISTYIDSLANRMDYFDGGNTTAQLYNKLKKYRQDILNVDSEMNAVFSKKIQIISKTFDQSEKSGPDTFDTLFTSISKQEKYNFLYTILNNIAIVENNMLTFCDLKVGAIREPFNVFSVLVGQNSIHFKPGENLEISAGVGVYSMAGNSHIKVDGKSITVADGVARYKIKVAGNVGKHTIPISFDYTDDAGTRQKFYSKIEYYIDN